MFIVAMFVKYGLVVDGESMRGEKKEVLVFEVEFVRHRSVCSLTSFVRM